MRLVWVVIPLVLVVSLIGIIGVQTVDSRECLGSPCSGYQPLRIIDGLGNSIGIAKMDQQYTLSWTVNNHLSKFIPCQEIIMVNASQFDFANRTWGIIEKEKCISGNKWVTDERINDYPPSPVTVILQVKDEEKRTAYLAWIEASVPPNDSKTFDFSWTPKKIGQHTLTIFTWKSLDNPAATTPPTSTTVKVTETGHPES